MDPPNGPRHARGGRHSRQNEPLGTVSADLGRRESTPLGSLVRSVEDAGPEQESEFDPNATVVLPSEALRTLRRAEGNGGGERQAASESAPGRPRVADPDGWRRPGTGQPGAGPPTAGQLGGQAGAGPARPEAAGTQAWRPVGQWEAGQSRAGQPGAGMPGAGALGSENLGGVAGSRAAEGQRTRGRASELWTARHGPSTSRGPGSRAAGAGWQGAPGLQGAAGRSERRRHSGGARPDERLAAVRTGTARIAGAAGLWLAAVGRRGLQAMRDLDERIRHDPARRERSAMLVVGGVALVVVLAMSTLLVLAGTGGGSPGTRSAAAVGTRGAGRATPTAPATASRTPTAATTGAASPTDPAGAVLRVLQSGMCLAVPGDTTEAGVQFVQRPCDGALGEQFHLVPVAGRVRTYMLVDALTGRCVDVQGAARDDGTPVIQWDCHGQPNQQFELRNVPGPVGSVQLVAQHSGKCVDVERTPAGDGEDGGDSGLVSQRTCQAAQVAATMHSQVWQLLR